jgi:hypothetical protein
MGGNRGMGKNPLEALRDLCLALPEATERLSHGEPTWFVRDKKTFVTYAERMSRVPWNFGDGPGVIRRRPPGCCSGRV